MHHKGLKGRAEINTNTWSAFYLFSKCHAPFQRHPNQTASYIHTCRSLVARCLVQETQQKKSSGETSDSHFFYYSCCFFKGQSNKASRYLSVPQFAKTIPSPVTPLQLPKKLIFPPLLYPSESATPGILHLIESHFFQSGDNLQQIRFNR